MNQKYSFANIQIIMGSVRPSRVCPIIARWVKALGEKVVSTEFEVIDLLDYPMRMDDEASLPMQGDYQSGSTRNWSEKITSADAFVFVVPQYNWGYPAVLKNALDHLYQEWVGKPALIVSYGGHGGGKCAAQLHQVLSGLKMHPLHTMPSLMMVQEFIETRAKNLVPDRDFSLRERNVLQQGLLELINSEYLCHNGVAPLLI